MRDLSMRTTLGYGLNNCDGGGMIPENIYRAALLELRDEILLPTGRWTTFYYESDKHGAVPYQSSSNTTGLNFYDVAGGQSNAGRLDQSAAQRCSGSGWALMPARRARSGNR
jgi:hypothetical protein